MSGIKGLRLLNIELIEEIEKWREPYVEIRKQATIPTTNEPIAFLYKGQNYLIKMINDVDFMATCPIEGLTFAIGNDPFILKPLKTAEPEIALKLQVDETLQQKIAECMDLLAR